MSLAWEVQCVSPTEKVVLLSLSDNANDEGVCWPSVANMCRRCNLTERSIQRSLASLTEAGHMSKIERPGRSSVFKIHPRQAGTPSRVSPHPRHRGTPPPPGWHPTPARLAPRIVKGIVKGTVSEPRRGASASQTRGAAGAGGVHGHHGDVGLGTQGGAGHRRSRRDPEVQGPRVQVSEDQMGPGVAELDADRSARRSTPACSQAAPAPRRA